MYNRRKPSSKEMKVTRAQNARRFAVATKSAARHVDVANLVNAVRTASRSVVLGVQRGATAKEMEALREVEEIAIASLNNARQVRRVEQCDAGFDMLYPVDMLYPEHTNIKIKNPTKKRGSFVMDNGIPNTKRQNLNFRTHIVWKKETFREGGKWSSKTKFLSYSKHPESLEKKIKQKIAFQKQSRFEQYGRDEDSDFHNEDIIVLRWLPLGPGWED